MFLSTEIFSKRRKIYAWMKRNQSDQHGWRDNLKAYADNLFYSYYFYISDTYVAINDKTYE